METGVSLSQVQEVGLISQVEEEGLISQVEEVE